MKQEINDSIDFVMGITAADISTTKRDRFGSIKEPKEKYTDWGVFGLGYRPGSCTMVSIFRLKNPDKKLFLSRLKKVCVHELGHNLGLHHCTSSDNCVMKDAAETIKTIDKVELSLCESCKNKVK
jgi:archaemetzincin